MNVQDAYVQVHVQRVQCVQRALHEDVQHVHVQHVNVPWSLRGHSATVATF